MSVGYGLRKLKITDASSLNVMNKLVFRVFLPLLLFLNIYSMRPEDALNHENISILVITTLSVLAIVLISHLILSRTVKDRKKCSVMIQGIFRSNLVLFGIPIVTSIYGENRIGLVSILAAFIVPLFNVLAVTILEFYRGSKVSLSRIIISIFKNPLIIASIVAFLLLILRIKIPDIILSPFSSMSKVATPLAFIVLGGTFQFNRLGVNAKYLTIVTIGKLILFPGIVFAIVILLGFRNEALVALIGAISSPTAVSSFTMSVEMDADGELAGQIVVITSIACILTIFLWVLILRTLQLI
jgi:predicted permease